MEIRVKFLDNISILTNDNYIFNFVKSRRAVTVNNVYKCSDSKCTSKITLNPDKTKILSADLQHNHIAPPKSATKSNTKNNGTPVQKSKDSATNQPVKKSQTKPSTSKSVTLVDKNPSSTVANSSHDSTFSSAAPQSSTSQNNKHINKVNNTSKSNSDDITLHNASTFSPNSHSLKNVTPSNLRNNNSNLKCKSIKRIFIFSDSHGRDLSAVLRNNYVHPECHVSSLLKPNARFADVVGSIPDMCKDADKNDIIFLLAGTNNLSSPNLEAELSLGCLVPLASKTNIIVCSIPFRFDDPQLSTSLTRANLFLKNTSTNQVGKFLECNTFLHRSCFTRHGLHMNRRGKRIFALKCALFIDEHFCNAPAIIHSGGSIVNQGEVQLLDESTFVIHSRADVNNAPSGSTSSRSLQLEQSLFTFTPQNDSSAGLKECEGYHTPYSTPYVQNPISKISVAIGNRPERDESNFQRTSSTPII